uniref:Uncharacterized protein n=1 Tax=Sphingobacterium sp. (strain 21) TaxID=743722 RepID=F4C450_SPHS2
MIHGKFYTPENHTPFVVFEYPERAKQSPCALKVSSQEEAYCLWRVHTRKYILDTLKSFVMQRKRALEMYKSSKDYADQYGHIFLLLSELPRQHFNKLEAVAGAVYYLTKHIDAIKPWNGSPFRRHYNEVIAPILEWCEEFSKPYRRVKQP